MATRSSWQFWFELYGLHVQSAPPSLMHPVRRDPASADTDRMV